MKRAMEDEEARRAREYALRRDEDYMANAPLRHHQNMSSRSEMHQEGATKIPESQDAHMSGTGLQYAPLSSYSEGPNPDRQQPEDCHPSIKGIHRDALERRDQTDGQYKGNKDFDVNKDQHIIPDSTRGIDPGEHERGGKTMPMPPTYVAPAQTRQVQVLHGKREIHPQQVQGTNGSNGHYVWEKEFWTSQSNQSNDPNKAVQKPKGQIDKIIRENNVLQGELSVARDHIKRTEQVYIEYKNRISRLEAENDRLNKVQEAQESQVRKAQDLMLKRNTTSQAGLGDEDKTIRLNFKALQLSIRDWGRDWAIEDITIIQKLKEPDRTEIMRHLAKVVRIDDDELPKGMTSGRKMAARSPALCLSALLSNEVCKSILGKPFAALRASSSDRKAPERRVLTESDTMVDSIYQSLVDCNEEKAQAWRCQTLEIFDPSVPKNEGDYLAQNAARNRRWNMAHDITAGFLSGPTVLLLRTLAQSEGSEKRKESLRSIFKEAIEISGRLWKQPTIMKCKLFEDLVMEPFTVGSEVVEAHPLHQLGFKDEEEDESRLDGHRVIMVVFPAILGLGNSDGENYIQHRVWAKGIVLLEE